MITCGNCREEVGSREVTCPNCDALLAAWAPAHGSNQSVTYDQPDYARPPADRPLFPIATANEKAASADPLKSVDTMDKSTASTLVNAIHAMDEVTAQRLVNTIRAYAHKRDAQSKRIRTAASAQQSISPSADKPFVQISNIAFAIGASLAVVLILMWGIVGAMVFSNMRSIEFIIITIVLTLAFKPTMSTIRRIFP